MAALTTPTAASVLPSSTAVVQVFTAGGTITIGKPVYNSTGSTVIEANANSTVTAAEATAIGVALNSCASGQRVMVCLADTTFTHGFTAAEITAGAFVYLDDNVGAYTITAGDLTAGDFITYIGQINNPETTMNLAPKTPILSAA